MELMEQEVKVNITANLKKVVIEPDITNKFEP